MKYNCELPLELLNKFNIENNDIDFVLFHLYEADEEYKTYYKTLRETHPDRKMIFDNSAYEYYVRGIELDTDAYVNAIIDLQPDFYLLPDKLMEKDITINMVKEFLNKYSVKLSNCKSHPMAVIQGNTEDEMMNCLETFQYMGLEDIAVPFHNSFYTEIHISPSMRENFAKAYNKNVEELSSEFKYAMGRVVFMMKYMDNFKHNHPDSYIHMLGSHCPHESYFYENMPIDSMDTGYPVKCAMRGLILYREPFKPYIIIDDFYKDVIGEYLKKLIKRNMDNFKNHKYE